MQALQRPQAADLHVESSGSGPALVWAHALMASVAADRWADWDALAGSVRVVRYDARGHGRSARPADPAAYRWDRLGTDMLAVADGAGAARFIAGGASMGCATALCAALRSPGRVRALVLVLPPAAWEARAPQADKYRRGAALGAVLGARPVARLVALAAAQSLPPWLARAEPQRAAAIGAGLAGLDGTAWAALMTGAAASNLPPRAGFAALAGMPALIVGWEGDPTHPLEPAHELHALLPRSSLFIARDYDAFCTIPARIAGFIGALGPG